MAFSQQVVNQNGVKIKLQETSIVNGKKFARVLRKEPSKKDFKKN